MPQDSHEQTATQIKSSNEEAFYHFSGVAGAGMNPMARLLAARGYRVQGSDRSLDQGQNQAIKSLLLADGITLLPQDGSAIHEGLDICVHSTAVEMTTPEMQAIEKAGLKRQTRPQLLAELLNNAEQGVAVSGTSGKSTVTGMIAWILRECNIEASILGGAALAEDGAQHMGCFAAASADAPLVAEACESDGTLRGYHPTFGIIHNITRDHDELEGLREQFLQFARQSKTLLVNISCKESVAVAQSVQENIKIIYYGVVAEGSEQAVDYQLEYIQPGPRRSQGSLTFNDHEYVLDIPQPGFHNVENACAALVLCHELGVPLDRAVAALRDFPGVARRFQDLGVNESGIRVIDDYAHNADKIRAAIEAAQAGCDRLLAIFQPHGFGPARFLRPELKELFPRLLRDQDKLCYAPIFYAGGTVAKDISSKDLALDIPRLAVAHDTKQDVVMWVCETAIPGDSVLLMGARDPSLGELAQLIFDMS